MVASGITPSLKKPQPSGLNSAPDPLDTSAPLRVEVIVHLEPRRPSMARRKSIPPKPPADIFAPTRPNAPGGKRGPGRPPMHAEAWTKVTVVLFNRQIG